jgi:hypothetical protein
MNNKLTIVAVIASMLLFSTCKKSAQVELAGSWKMSCLCDQQTDRSTMDVQIFPGSGDDEILLSDLISKMIVFYSKTGEVPVSKYSSSPSSRDLPATVDKKDVKVDYTYNDSSFDPVNDRPERDKSYNVSGSGTVSEKNQKITLDLTVTFPKYDPLIKTDGTEAATPKPLSNKCQYTLVKLRHDNI